MNSSDDAKTAFAKRLNDTLTEKGYTQRGSAQRLKREAKFTISDRAINKWLKAETLPDHHNIEVLAKFLGVNFNWLAAGQGEKIVKQNKSVLPQKITELDSIKNSNTVQVSDDASGMIEIPLYGVYFCCGHGDTNCEFQEIKGTRRFPPSFFRERNIQPENFKLVCASNGSMAPYINDKDEVGLNLASTEVHDGKVYAILLDGDRMFKQIFREAGGALRLHSFNSDYPDRLVTAENHSSLIIVGEQVYRAG